MSAGFLGSGLVGLQLGRITTFLGGEAATVVRCLGGMCVLYLLLASAFEPLFFGLGRKTADGGVWLYACLTLALALFQFPLATTITSVTTSRVPAQLKGTLVGFEHAIFASAGLVSPIAGVALYQAVGLGGVAASAATAFGALHTAWRLKGGGVIGGGGGGGAEAKVEPRRSPRLVRKAQ